MISKEAVEQFAKVVVDHNKEAGQRSSDWNTATPNAKRAYIDGVAKAFRTIGVKVEGEDEPRF